MQILDTYFFDYFTTKKSGFFNSFVISYFLGDSDKIFRRSGSSAYAAMTPARGFAILCPATKKKENKKTDQTKFRRIFAGSYPKS